MFVCQTSGYFAKLKIKSRVRHYRHFFTICRAVALAKAGFPTKTPKTQLWRKVAASPPPHFNLLAAQISYKIAVCY